MVGFCLFLAVDEQDKFTNIKDYDRFLKESLAWAKGNGWTGKIGNLKTLL